MELRAKVLYHASFGTILEGGTTEGIDISDEMKEQILADHPEWFEVVGTKAKPEPVDLIVETKEDSLTVETPEAKLGKTRKK